MKLVSYNIQYGLGADGRYDLTRIADEIRDADIIALQEVDRYWARSGMVDTPQVIADALGDRYWVYGANFDMDASFRGSEGRLVSRRRQFGTMVLSRFPILSSRNFPLPKFATLTQHSIQQGMLETVIEADGRALRVYSVHLSHLCAETRLPQVEAMLDIFARAPAEGGAWCGGHPDPASGWTEGDMPPMPRDMVVMGDMNFTADSAEYARMIGPRAGQYGRLVNRDGLADVWVAGGNPESEGSTHPQAGRIDHCFVSASLAGNVRRCWADGEARGSDHYPLWTELNGLST
ncbi:endonuclease/exonuclease/phosphatase family protein [Pararhizobium sp. YC-54]|uniref:endonuclease/exonuclease/phosphatase family protein n=1 Tax=Pararhizobium sp. YC-54 TaxID=2986920 RepID=UPI0021F73B26|nr:endonuclease/exonuclease/phosphatase family protein [Pararhizobium sp. YC-54]MCW0000263.1 endonuclease/exonuclease/phosphatase family protein [Pararhizobium sp. YC-54]